MPQPAQDNPVVQEKQSVSRPLRLEFLDGLRGLAALYVVLFHFTASRYLVDSTGARLPLPLPLRVVAAVMQYGHYAVAVFIVLSGYSLMLPVVRARNGQLRGGFAGYLKRRAWRILPPYYAALLLSLFCFALARRWQDVSWGAAWSHLLLVHNLNPDWNMAINIPLWSVATEWDIYFVFPLLLLPLWRKWGMGVAIIAAFGLGWLPHFGLPPAHNLDWACPWYLGLFSLGMGAAVVTVTRASQPAKRPSGFWSALAVIPAAAFLAVAVTRPLWMEQRQWLLDPVVGMFAACLILTCAEAALHKIETPGLLLRVLEHRGTLRLGAFSYSLYLTHILVKWGLYALLSGLSLSPVTLQLILLLVGVPASLLTAWGFYLLVERHFLSARSKARRMETVSAAIRPSQEAGETRIQV